ncbi:hypothetical protein PROFUN_03211 [Planoprotostelium fungivorum]|uniref:C3H1-type domain-containing protein n=1 Tax=Planoprotostelium fungivorum TaxID=1890364 RepID=A0A2P6NWZ9_9EUKA|nr:hypothetical protein PROFUN_03211 [Planoprotostelium fungivorum]
MSIRWEHRCIRGCILTDSRKPCSFFPSGKCRSGDNCRFEHDTSLVKNKNVIRVKEARLEDYDGSVDDVSNGAFIIGPKDVIERCSKMVNERMEDNFTECASQLRVIAERCSPDNYKASIKYRGITRREALARYMKDLSIETKVLDETEHATTFGIALGQSMKKFTETLSDDIKSDALRRVKAANAAIFGQIPHWKKWSMGEKKLENFSSFPCNDNAEKIVEKFREALRDKDIFKDWYYLVGCEPDSIKSVLRAGWDENHQWKVRRVNEPPADLSLFSGKSRGLNIPKEIAVQELREELRLDLSQAIDHKTQRERASQCGLAPLILQEIVEREGKKKETQRIFLIILTEEDIVEREESDPLAEQLNSMGLKGEK